MLHKARQVKNESVQVYAQRLYALANDAFTKVDKAVVELQLVAFFIDGLYHDFLCMKVMRENSTFHCQKKNLRKIFQLRSNDHDNPKGRTEEPMENTSLKTSEKMFLMLQGGHLAKQVLIS